MSDRTALIYELSLESYRFAMDRFAVVESRLGSLINTVIGVTFAVPTLSLSFWEKTDAPKQAFVLLPFILAITCGFVAIVIGVYRRNSIKMILPDPNLLVEGNDLDSDEFRQRVVKHAARHRNTNAEAVQDLAGWKGGYLISLLLVVEVLLFTIWIVLSQYVAS